jgi:hypothetical protein
VTGPPDDGRWPVWQLALLLYPFAATAVAINLFMIALIGLSVGLPSLSPLGALAAGAVLGVPASHWAGRRLRALIDEADGR